MVPRIVNGEEDKETGDCDEDHLLSARESISSSTGSRCINTKNHLSKEELELGFQNERRKQRFRIAALCCISVGVGTLCAFVGYSVGWSSWTASEEWNSHVREVQLDPKAIYEPLERIVLYIGILSAPANFQQRIRARREWVDHARKDIHGRVKVEFLVGHAANPGALFSSQGIDMSTEKEIEQRLQHEASLHTDVTRIPVDTSAVTESDRVIWILANGVESKARFVVKVNDDEMVVVGELLKRLELRPPIAQPIYFGQVWTTNIMPEADGKRSWFFQGCYGISGGLAHKISVVHRDHTAGFPMFGSTSADVNVAKWVNFEDNIRRKNNILPVRHIWMPKLCRSITALDSKDIDALPEGMTPEHAHDGIHMTEWKTS